MNSRNFEGDTPLTLACFLGQASVARYLIKAGADVKAVSKRGFTPLLSLVWTNMFMTRAIMDRSPALRNAQLELLKLLIDKGADINAAGDKGTTALHGAVWNARTLHGETPLHIAAEMGHERTVKVLLERGADASAVDGNGLTARQRAEAKGKMDVAAIL